MHKADWLGRMRPSRQRTSNMGIQQRLTAAMSLAAPWQQLTPDQQWFRDDAQGLWAGDIRSGGANAGATLVKRHPCGTTDVTNLESNGMDWLDLGGQGGRDVAVGRP